MVVHREFANRTICIDFIQGQTCKFDGWAEGGCWYSHTLVDMGELESLVCELVTSSMSIWSIVIEYFGKAGWKIKFNFASKEQAPMTFQHARLDLAINNAREALKLWVTPSMAAAYAAKKHNPRKPMTMCRSHMLDGLCPRGNNCWNSHSLVDTARIDRIAGSPKHTAHKPLVAITRNHIDLWKVVLKARFIGKTLRILETPVFAHCEILGDALTSVENKCISGTLDYQNETQVPVATAKQPPPPPYIPPPNDNGGGVDPTTATEEAGSGWIGHAINIAIPLLALALGYKAFSCFQNRHTEA